MQNSSKSPGPSDEVVGDLERTVPVAVVPEAHRQTAHDLVLHLRDEVPQVVAVVLDHRVVVLRGERDELAEELAVGAVIGPHSPFGCRFATLQSGM